MSKLYNTGDLVAILYSFDVKWSVAPVDRGMIMISLDTDGHHILLNKDMSIHYYRIGHKGSDTYNKYMPIVEAVERGI